MTEKGTDHIGEMNDMGNEDHCYECTGYGDDYYYDAETDRYVKACDDCPYNGRDEDDE